MEAFDSDSDDDAIYSYMQAEDWTEVTFLQKALQCHALLVYDPEKDYYGVCTKCNKLGPFGYKCNNCGRGNKFVLYQTEWARYPPPELMRNFAARSAHPFQLIIASPIVSYCLNYQLHLETVPTGLARQYEPMQFLSEGDHSDAAVVRDRNSLFKPASSLDFGRMNDQVICPSIEKLARRQEEDMTIQEKNAILEVHATSTVMTVRVQQMIQESLAAVQPAEDEETRMNDLHHYGRELIARCDASRPERRAARHAARAAAAGAQPERSSDEEEPPRRRRRTRR